MVKRPIHLWVSGLQETGGIQHYSRCCLQAVCALYPGHAVRVFSKNDRAGDVTTLCGPQVSVHTFGAWRGAVHTAGFALYGLMRAWRERPAFILSTHPHFMKALKHLPGLGIPCLASAHGIEVWGHLQGRLGDALRGATGLLPVSQFTADAISREGGVNAVRMRVVPNTFDEERFFPGAKSGDLLLRYGLKEDQPVLLTVGRLSASERYKGQDQVLIALPRIVKDLPTLRYLIAGRGDDEPRLRQLAVDLGVTANVTFTGFIADAELAAHYRLADLYVMPSTGEGFGVVFLESLACGRPCLVGDLDASKEAVDGGRLGIVVNPRDPARIAVEVCRFFARPADQLDLRDPAFLHTEVLRLFGREAFQRRLGASVSGLLLEGGFKDRI